MKLLDLSKFSKTAQDKHTATLKHSDGHTMTILLKALPPIQREQLGRLKMADGGDVQSDDSGDAKSPAPANITINAGSAAPAQAPVSAAAQPMAGTTPVTYNPAVQMGQADTGTNVPAPVQPESNLNPNGTMNPGAVARNTQLANQGQQQVDTAHAEGMTGNEQNYIDQATAAAGQRQRYLNDITGHVNALNQYAQDNPINPNHYAENLSAPAKVTTALSLLLGGFGQGMTGGSNPGMDFLNKQMDRDIQGQRDRMDQQKTIYGAYHQLYGDSVATNAATKASMIDIYQHRANQIAAQLGTPQAAAKAAALGAQGAAEKSKLLQESVYNLQNAPGYTAPGMQGSPRSTGKSNGGGQSIEPSGNNKSANQPDYLESNGMRVYPVLKPGALQTVQGLKNTKSVDYDNLNKQTTALDQLDKVFNGPTGDGSGGIHELLTDMYQDIGGNASQPASRISGAATAIGTGAAEVPGIGNALQSAVGLMGGEGYRDFMRKRTNMISDLSTGLQGIVAPTDIVRIVDENLPKGGETVKSRDEAERQIVNSLKKAIPTTLAEGQHILAPQMVRKRNH
jgi:hypothetical protein